MKRKSVRAGENATSSGRKWKIFVKLLLLVAFLSFLAMDGYRFIRGFQYWQRNREIKQGYVRDVDRLREEKKQLEEKLQRLEHSLLAQERLAREMGYIKPGETVYKIKQTTQSSLVNQESGK